MVDDLVKAWMEWDAKPGDVTRAANMERVCEEYAKKLGVTTTVLRRKLAAARRQGFAYHEAIASVV